MRKQMMARLALIAVTLLAISFGGIALFRALELKRVSMTSPDVELSILMPRWNSLYGFTDDGFDPARHIGFGLVNDEVDISFMREVYPKGKTFAGHQLDQEPDFQSRIEVQVPKALQGKKYSELTDEEKELYDQSLREQKIYRVVVGEQRLLDNQPIYVARIDEVLEGTRLSYCYVSIIDENLGLLNSTMRLFERENRYDSIEFCVYPEGMIYDENIISGDEIIEYRRLTDRMVMSIEDIKR